MIDNEYQLTRILGSGGSSKVFLATDSSNCACAVKVIRKDKNLSPVAASAMLEREHEMLVQLQAHPNIIRSHLTCLDGQLSAKGQSEPVMYNVLELAKHGALSNFVRHTGGMEQEVARLYACQLVSALAFMHSAGFAHLDVKLENVLLDGLFNLKLADFGSCAWVGDSQGVTDKRRGTLLYMAPEVAGLQTGEHYDAMAADVYCAGVTLFVLLTGEFPSAQDKLQLLSTIESDQSTVCDMQVDDDEQPTPALSMLTKDVRALLQSMMHPEAIKRPSIEQVLNHDWLRAEFSPDIMGEVYLEMNSRKEHMQTSFAGARNRNM